MIRILLADDHEMVRIGVSAYLQAQPDMEVVAEAINGKEAVNMALEHRPDIILMDMVMPIMSGAEATREIVQQWPEAKVMIVTSFIDDDKVYPALEAGAISYLLKTSKASHIADSIRKTLNGDAVLEPEVTNKMMKRMRQGSDHALHDDLTDREHEVLLLMAEGKTNQDIADTLFIALKTAKTHVSNILSKLEVSDRTQAVIYAFEHKLVPTKK
ncbi:two component transcriptional regulator, LuxR family [Paenisporosarcina quisquiliarum]|jgi:two-component system, NarL family, response regulator LiaR|uniref:response regulator transcription factor n=1 Tax=Psychrobacillus TaxID=1221880 RepID=UPI0008CE03A0|nr:response regulator transcription factor [Psychrobacillus psychrodurans]MCK1999484.1 response regulator transcription factor [Psychrobacillus psychrodurans]MCZ8540756.1 response regulator transcription factor [Psychrobacillus psychrodurans]SEN78168.1 two component transcriptional regulator, LuxR family [Paenisporosarcina quisquiliarum]SFM74841.1 two-component system, NarL family, response regulator LiaR [Psychrobacillus psychrodurans]